MKQPIDSPDENNLSPEYWEKVLESHDLSESRGMSPQFWVDRGTDHQKQLRRVLYVGSNANIAGIEKELIAKRSGKNKTEGSGPD